jgi:hypothetical protein
VAHILRAPYYRTLWTFLHLQQRERIDDLLSRGRALHGASLSAIAFHEPKRLSDEQRRLMEDAGQVPTPETTLKAAEWIIDAVATLDAHEARAPEAP